MALSTDVGRRPFWKETQMRIGLIAAPWVPVPPPAYGGTEVVVDQLAQGLSTAGHDVHLFTVAESSCPVRRSWRYERPMAMENSVIEAAHVIAAYAALTDVDLIHDHTLLGPLYASRSRRPRPVVSTIHSPFTPDTRRIHAVTAADVPLICISHDQRSAAPEVPVAAVIHHGIDPAAFPMGDGDGDYLLFLGRMSPDKGVDRAIALARAAGLRLLIAAKMREPDERAYFAERVAPLLGPDVEYVGEVGCARRLELLQHARALLNPIQWPEPFGLVMVEALMCGTPVVARALGAAPEIIEHGRTGFLCAHDDELLSALGAVAGLRRQECRRSAATRFSTERMVAEHVALYEAVLAGRRRPGTPDRTGGLVRAAAS
jgi:glycosyltransferase involved in cell wall biosynthesis